MAYNALLVAKYIIFDAYQAGSTISNLKLQKILYYVQADFLVEADKSCFNDRIEAWDFGPVVPVVYFKYRIYGSADIPQVDQSECRGVSRDDERRINEMTKRCCQYTTSQLVSFTHYQDPWINAYNNAFDHEITIESIKNFFKQA